jgi:hypothetical protein
MADIAQHTESLRILWTSKTLLDDLLSISDFMRLSHLSINLGRVPPKRTAFLISSICSKARQLHSLSLFTCPCDNLDPEEEEENDRDAIPGAVHRYWSTFQFVGDLLFQITCNNAQIRRLRVYLKGCETPFDGNVLQFATFGGVTDVCIELFGMNLETSLPESLNSVHLEGVEFYFSESSFFSSFLNCRKLTMIETLINDISAVFTNSLCKNLKELTMDISELTKGEIPRVDGTTRDMMCLECLTFNLQVFWKDTIQYFLIASASTLKKLTLNTWRHYISYKIDIIPLFQCTTLIHHERCVSEFVYVYELKRVLPVPLSVQLTEDSHIETSLLNVFLISLCVPHTQKNNLVGKSKIKRG